MKRFLMLAFQISFLLFGFHQQQSRIFIWPLKWEWASSKNKMLVNVCKHSIAWFANSNLEWHLWVSILAPNASDLCEKCKYICTVKASFRIERSGSSRTDRLTRSTFSITLGAQVLVYLVLKRMLKSFYTHLWYSSTHNARSTPEKCSIVTKFSKNKLVK